MMMVKPTCERTVAVANATQAARVFDRRVDFEPVPHDAFIGQQARPFV
jgi:hypothetical protein